MSEVDNTTATTEEKTLVQKIVAIPGDYVKAVVDDPINHAISAGLGLTYGRREMQHAVKKEGGQASLDETKKNIAFGSLPFVNVQ